MQASFSVTASSGAYDVAIEVGSLDATLGAEGDRVFIVDAFLADRLRDAGVDAIAIPADETAKSLDRIPGVITALRERGATRATTLVAVGGGIIQDIAAFAASTYMRGVDWIYLPTTLLSMTDSCIGGKSSINVGKYKNIVGTFHPPVSVVIDPSLTATLSPEQRAAGLCEAAKICFCRGLEEFDGYRASGPSVDADTERLANVVERSLRAKKWFIETDEFDREERLLLNFGHTFGHAIEAASGFAIGHGIAVGLGMLAAIALGEAMGRDYSAIPQVAALGSHVSDLIAVADGLPEALAALDADRLIEAFRSDKKHSREHFAVILVDDYGRAERRLLPRDGASTGMIAAAFDGILRARSAAGGRYAG